MQKQESIAGYRLRVVAALGAALCASPASALQFDSANVTSGLNEPLNANLTISGLSARQTQGLEIRLAPKTVYQRFDLTRDLAVGRLEVKTTLRDGAGLASVQVTTRRPVQQPVLSFVLVAENKDGRYLHRYDLLINPTASAATAGPADSSAAVASQPRAARPSRAPRQRHETRPVGGDAYASERRKNQNRPGPGEPRKHANYGPVEAGETLWRIAERLKPAGATTRQMARALYRATPNAFSGGMDTLRRGAVLTVPYDANVRAMSDGARAPQRP